MTAATHTEHSDHPHVHADACGHESFRHGDHTDFAHDGHLHRAHDGHVDDCEPGGHALAEHSTDEHRHGEGCRHHAVVHRDHPDYVHDGHRHAAHGSHYDEH